MKVTIVIPTLQWKHLKLITMHKKDEFSKTTFSIDLLRSYYSMVLFFISRVVQTSTS